MTLIRIDDALRILTLFRNQRLTDEERGRVNSAIEDLRRAQVDPKYMEWLHVPKRIRNIMEKSG